MSAYPSPAVMASIATVAARYAVAPITVRRAIARGDLRANRIGRAIRISIAEADRWATGTRPTGGRAA